jgi:hypothetical protein
MRTIKTYLKGAPFYNAFLGAWVDAMGCIGNLVRVLPTYDLGELIEPSEGYHGGSFSSGSIDGRVFPGHPAGRVF